MKQEELENALTAYRESLGRCEREPDRRPRPSPFPRRLVFGFATLAALAVAGVALWPQDASAARVRKVVMAVSNAKTMEILFTVERPVGKWWTLSHMYYRNGMWRSDVDKSSPLRVTVISKNGLLLTDYAQLDHTTLERGSADILPDESGEMNALEFAKKLLNTGNVSVTRGLTIAAHPKVHGRETYAIKMTRPQDDYRAELVVDKATDLPIYGEASLDQTTGLGPEKISYRQEYRFNEPMSDDLFSFDRKKPMVKVPEARAALLASWRKPFAKLPGVEVRDVCVTPDGTVWVATSSRDSLALPETLTADGGDVYIRGTDIHMADGETHETLKIDGNDVSVVPFIDMYPNSSAPEKVNLTFSQRMVAWQDYVPDKPLPGLQVTLKPRIEPEIKPSWFTLIGGDRLGFQLELLAWDIRGKQYRSEGKYLQAAHAYERSAAAYKNFVKRGAYFPMSKAAQCYQLAGDPATAARVGKLAEEIREKKER